MEPDGAGGGGSFLSRAELVADGRDGLKVGRAMAADRRTWDNGGDRRWLRHPQRRDTPQNVPGGPTDGLGAEGWVKEPPERGSCQDGFLTIHGPATAKGGWTSVHSALSCRIIPKPVGSGSDSVRARGGELGAEFRQQLRRRRSIAVEEGVRKRQAPELRSLEIQ